MNLSETTGRWIGRDFKDHGCLDFCHSFLKDLGFNPPERVGDWGVDNYRELVDADIKKAQSVMLKLFLKIGNAAPAAYPTLADLLVVRQADGVYFPAVYVGAGKAIASFIKKGVAIFVIDAANQVVMARRLG